MPRENLSLNEARRIALAAQGFDRPRPRASVSAQHLTRTIRQLGLLQIDFVNVLLPAHYLIPFSRLGAYRRSVFDKVVYRQGDFTEQWAHEASIVTMETWPLLRHRMESHRVRPWGFEAVLAKHTAYADQVLDEIRKRGPLAADDLHVPDGLSRRLDNSWIGTIPRAVLEAHFGRGLLAVAERRPNFSRAFDLAERLIPGEHYGRQVDRERAQRELLLMAARSYGVGTAADLADYYRMPIKEARARIAELAAAGNLRQVQVEGWREPAYLHPKAKLPGEINASALLSPFDPVV
ncbi:MAG: winged helix-turn-helix domain-containing protein, partial [Burkholderiales bacterium]